MSELTTSRLLAFDILEMSWRDQEPSENTKAMFESVMNQVSQKPFDPRHGERLALVSRPEADGPAVHRTTMVQLLDICRLHVRHASIRPHPHIMLHHVVALSWSCSVSFDDLGQPRETMLHSPCPYEMNVLLDGEIELQVSHGHQQNHLLLALSPQHFAALLEQSRLLGLRLEAAVEFGKVVTMGQTQQQRESNMDYYNKAGCMKFIHHNFCRDMTTTTSPITSAADLAQHAKDSWIGRLPNILIADIDHDSYSLEGIVFFSNN